MEHTDPTGWFCGERSRGHERHHLKIEPDESAKSKATRSPPFGGGFPIQLKLNLLKTSASADGGSSQSHRSGLSISHVDAFMIH